MKKTLHQYDHLFFASPFEPVLPWNFDDLRQRAGQHFVIRRGRPRPDRGETHFVVPGLERNAPAHERLNRVL